MFDSSTQSRSNAQLEGMISPLTFFKAKLESGAILAIGEAHWYGELFEKMTDVLLDAELDGMFSHLFIE
ncbi:hypothetical protein HAR99_13775, partial [Vibrio campbellii]|nr:hypothetical protein [Vibrio campbellii]